VFWLCNTVIQGLCENHLSYHRACLLASFLSPKHGNCIAYHTVIHICIQANQLRKFVAPRMNSKNRGSIQNVGVGKAKQIHGGGPNWVLVAGGVLLSTLSVKLGCKLKQLFVSKQKNSTSKGQAPPFASATFTFFIL
jgi:hypothetical protein